MAWSKNKMVMAWHYPLPQARREDKMQKIHSEWCRLRTHLWVSRNWNLESCWRQVDCLSYKYCYIYRDGKNLKCSTNGDVQSRATECADNKAECGWRSYGGK